MNWTVSYLKYLIQSPQGINCFVKECNHSLVSPFNADQFVFSHIPGKTIQSVIFDHLNSFLPVGIEDNGKQLCEQVVEFPALHDVFKFSTVRTTGVSIFDAA